MYLTIQDFNDFMHNKGINPLSNEIQDILIHNYRNMFKTDEIYNLFNMLKTDIKPKNSLI